MLSTPQSRDHKGRPSDGFNQANLVRDIDDLLPTPNTMDGLPQRSDEALDRAKASGGCSNLKDHPLIRDQLLPTPAVNDMGAAYTPETWDAWTERMKAAHNNGNGHGPSLNIEAQRVSLLPTTTTEPNTGNGHARNLGAEVNPSHWGKYAAAIARWEAITRPAPEPTNITAGYLRARAKRLARLDRRPVGMRGSLKVRRQLAAEFSSWMMGVPLGWITATPGITRNEALKAAGNGVVPQQAAEALRFLLAMPTGREIAAAFEPVDLFELAGVSR